MKSEYAVVVLIPYFGKLPDIFPYWLKTSGYNPTIDWIIFTDDERAFDGTYTLPEAQNVRMIQMTLSDVKTKAEKILNTSVSLERPYKICDFKPAYGLLFEDYIREYDFWGYGDLDVLYGNLRHFITDEVLRSYDKIYTNGFLSFYRNNPDVNHWFQTLHAKPGRENWKEVFSSDKNWAFDEWAGHMGGGMTAIIEDNGKAMYMVNDWANIKPEDGRLSYQDHGVEAKDTYFIISKNGIHCYDRKTHKKIDEVSFIHMYRRPPICIADASAELYYYLPPNIVSNNYENNPISIILYHVKNKFLSRIKIKVGALKKRAVLHNT